MKATIITACIIIIIISAIAIIIISLSPYIPMLFERKGWKAWKQCYNNDDFVKTQECELGVRYDWNDNDYCAFVFKKADGKYYASIFKKETLLHDFPIFCTYYSYHSRKLAKKLIGE